MERLINVFIGGSSEALSISKRVKSLIEGSGEIRCTIWNEGVFEFNQTFLRSLEQACYSYDFGILIASKDDIANVRNNLKDIPRDNVVFEYGLFLGVMGNNRTFLVQEKGANLPTDILGNTTPQFRIDFSESEWIKLAHDLIVAIKSQFQKSEIQALPSTALAIGYFNSFLKSVAHYTYLKERGKPLLNNNLFEHREAKIQIVIPNELSESISAKANKYYNDKGYVPDGLGDPNRPFPIRFYRNKEDLVIVDMPTTLNAIRPAVNLLMPDSGVGINETRLLIERRELENFKKTLEYLIQQDDYARSIVEASWQND
ncbi:MAG: nucleotide-binding protein [Imperialibacter sp.]|uniref:TIR domain-containing protein n=1 Tax=Imperialibacter sp. TaxID=2038411 RepID=UPI0032EF811C